MSSILPVNVLPGILHEFLFLNFDSSSRCKVYANGREINHQVQQNILGLEYHAVFVGLVSLWNASIYDI